MLRLTLNKITAESKTMYLYTQSVLNVGEAASLQINKSVLKYMTVVRRRSQRRPKFKTRRVYQPLRYVISIITLTIITNAYAAPTFIAGKDYRALSPTARSAAANLAPDATEQPTVIEFFSYGCPACYRLEPDMKKWVAGKPANVHFQRIPVTFQPGWNEYAKAYYIAESLGILNKITPAMFNAIHVKHDNLAQTTALAKLFAQYGVSQTQFNAIFQQSPALTLAIANGDKLMQLYGINAVPTIIVNNHYVTSAVMTGDSTKLFQVIDYLIKK